MKNDNLTQIYNKVYREGSEKFYSFSSFSESMVVLQMIPSWNEMNVLEIGCGEGRLAAMLGFAGARQVDAVDYSEEAIQIARSRISLPNVSFRCAGYQEIHQKYDAVVMQGVLEHLNHPFQELKYIIDQNVKNGGFLITSSPSFINPRGYVWMTLQLLFDVPMSLTDLHFICPFDMEKFATENNMLLKIKSTDFDWAAGDRTIQDFKKRLNNALRDANMPTENIDKFLSWLEKALPYHEHNECSGANIGYKLWRK